MIASALDFEKFRTMKVCFFCATTDSFTGRALPKGTGVLGKATLKSISCPTLHFTHPDLRHGHLPPCSKRYIFLIHTQSSYELAGVLIL